MQDRISGGAVSRRSFVAGAAAGAALLAPMAARASETADAQATQWDHEADVVVVGLGGAGAAAAVSALDAGASVCVIEKAERGGGSTYICGGLVYMGGGTPLQQACGIEDTPEAMCTYIGAAAGPSADTDMIDVFCSKSLDLYDWCVEQGVSFEGSYYDGHTVTADDGVALTYSGNERALPYADIAAPAPRGHTPVGGGAGLFEALEAKVEAGATVLYETEATDLVTDESGAVVGVVAQDVDGSQVRVAARGGVVISTGAFTNNDAMLSDYAPEALLCGGRTGVANDQGDGIRMGQRVGAQTRSMSRYNAAEFVYQYGDLAAGVLLNWRGQRILSEDWYGAWVGRIVLQQTPDVCFVVADDAVWQDVVADGYGDWIAPAVQADTVEELVEACGLPLEATLATIERYNELCAAGEDADWGKDPAYLRPVETPPFRAFDFTPQLTWIHTLGGLRIDTSAQVLSLSGEPIGGLYAAGRSSSGIYGEYPGSGTSVADCLTFGRIAGEQAAARA